MEPLTASGIVTADPLGELPIGAEIKFVSRAFVGSAPTGLHTVANWNFFHGAVIALHFGSTSGSLILGSGVIVAPGMALAAKHVIEPWIGSLMAGDDGLICTAIVPGGVMIWRPRHISLVEGTDLALLALEYASA